jgi:hypothetical protein
MPTYLELLMDFYMNLGLRSDHSGQKTLLFVSNKTKVVVIHDNNVDTSPDKTWSDSRNFVDGRTIQKWKRLMSKTLPHPTALWLEFGCRLRLFLWADANRPRIGYRFEKKLTAITTSFQPFERASASYGFLEISLTNYRILLYNSRNKERFGTRRRLRQRQNSSSPTTQAKRNSPWKDSLCKLQSKVVILVQPW